MTGAKLVISDGHRGIINAVKESFPGILGHFLLWVFILINMIIYPTSR
ncbi:hypothetical protein [Acidiplasma cupricumulans]|nr:hypothetical protein [Acidiplasma cupricumulans]